MVQGSHRVSSRVPVSRYPIVAAAMSGVMPILYRTDKGLVEERLDKDIQNTVYKRLETLELDNRKSKYEFQKIAKILNTQQSQ